MSETRQKRYKQKHRTSGLCVDCKSVAIPGSKRCQRHLNYFKDRRLKLKENNRCIKCGQLLDMDCDLGRVKCLNCRESLFSIEYYDENKKVIIEGKI